MKNKKGYITDKDFNTHCPDCNTIMDLIYWGDQDSPDEWECPKCEA